MKLNYQKHACILLLILLLFKLCFGSYSNNTFRIIQGIIILLIYAAYFQIIISHPGPIKLRPPEIQEIPQLQNYCNKCHNYWKPPKAHHCNQCKICIFGYDHHCNWFGKCIGIKTIKFFLQFLIYSSIICIWTVLQASYQFFLLLYIHKSDILRLTVLLEVKLYFLQEGIFEIIQIIVSIHMARITLTLFCDKFSHILDNSNYIYQSHRKLLYGYNRGKLQNFLRLFGYNPILYFIPLQNKIRVNQLELTYEFPSKSEKDLDYKLDQGEYPEYQIN